MKTTTFLKIQKELNITVNVINKFSGYYAYEVEVFDWNSERAPFKVLLNNKESFYSQIKSKI